MAKIDYTKVEREIQRVQEALQKRQLIEGKPIISSRAQSYYGVDNEPRPVPEEAVEKLLNDEKEEEKLQKTGEAPYLVESSLPEIGAPTLDESGAISSTPKDESLFQYPKTKRKPPQRPIHNVNLELTSDKIAEKISPLYVLRQHILWMKRQHIDKRYELIGTSREEIATFRAKERIQDQDLVRINELIKKATYVRSVWEKKKLGAASLEELIDIMKKRSKNKRFNIRDKWLPL